MDRDSVDRIVIRLRTGRPRNSDSIPDKGWKFVFSESFRSALGPTQPHIEWVPGVKWLGHAEVKNELIFSPLPPTPSCYVGDNFYPLLSY
jgi:hypothetical protein